MSHSEQFTIKRDDTLPKIQAQCWDDEAKTQKTDLSSILRVNFHMMDRDQVGLASPTLKVESVGTVVAPAVDGVVEYAWDDTANDTDTKGIYFAEFEVEFTTTSRTTFPNDGYIIVKIVDDLDATAE